MAATRGASHGSQAEGSADSIAAHALGSCASSGTISLNAGLLFLEAPLVRYLFIHELCHLYSLSHSRRFWSIVEHFEPDYRALDRRLTEAWALVPLWVHES